jgi:hypothetical protein
MRAENFNCQVYLLSGLLFMCCPAADANEVQRLDVGQFSAGQLANWQEKSFSDETRYELTELDGKRVLRAQSNGSASGLYRKQRVDLHRYPFLNWEWRVENRLDTTNEQTRSGDDYAARIYVVVSGGVFFWKTRALNYVWANASAKQSVWPNAFAGGNAMMMALRSGRDDVSEWHAEKRNVLQDLKEIFGEDIRYVDAVALMTDTDNHRGRATAYYGDIFFSSK